MINVFESPHLYRFMSVEQEASDDLLVSLATFERLSLTMATTVRPRQLWLSDRRRDDVVRR